MDLNKFTKLMMLTQSSNDHEALSALRIANSILAENDLNWAEFLKDKQIIIKEIKIKKEPNPKIEQMLKACKAVRSSTGKTFIKSLNDWYNDKGFLTEKQIIALKHWYEHL